MEIDAIRARDAAVDWQNPGDIDLWQALDDRHDLLAALDACHALSGDTLVAAMEREARLRAALTPERMAAALVESDLIRRYDEYARVAYPATMTRDHIDTLARDWSKHILAAIKEPQP